MLKRSEIYCLVLLVCLQVTVENVSGSLSFEGCGAVNVGNVARLVKEEERAPIVATEFGSVSAVDIDDGTGRRNYHLQFITMEPNSLFLPVLLHSDMVFYVQTGNGRLSWTEGDDVNKVSLRRGDVYRLKSGTLFYLHSTLEPESPRFGIIAIFSNPDQDQFQGPSVGPYSSINDLVRGFDTPVLQSAFQVSEEVIEEIKSTTDTPAIVHSGQKSKRKFWEEEVLFINALFGIQRLAADNKKKHTKTFNFFKEDPDFSSDKGWSKVVTKHDLHALHGSEIGVFMVNLTKGSIMGPHWNPVATEVSVVLEGEGMVQVVCPSALSNTECKNSRIRVEEGDVFTVPRFHPMAQTSFNNGSLVFMGFSTASKKNHPQFLTGKASVLQTLDRSILGVSFYVPKKTVDQLLAAQDESIILGCISCAEEQEMVMGEEIERERREEEKRKREEEEEKRKREEEEARKREEEEEARKREEEEEERKREEEERKRREEEEKQRQREKEEERRRREEEEQKRREEEERRRREEEEQKKRKKEEEKRKREEDEKRQREQEEERRQEEEEQRRREEEEQRRQEEVEEQKRREEEEQRRGEEEEKREREEEEQRRREKEEEQRRREKEEEQRRREKEEEQKRREIEKEQRREEEEQRRKEKEEQRRRKEEEEQKRREEEQRKEQEEERQQEEERGRGEEESEGEIARREEDERVKRQREEEAGRSRRTVKPKINRRQRKAEGSKPLMLPSMER